MDLVMVISGDAMHWLTSPRGCGMGPNPKLTPIRALGLGFPERQRGGVRQCSLLRAVALRARKIDELRKSVLRLANLFLVWSFPCETIEAGPAMPRCSVLLAATAA